MGVLILKILILFRMIDFKIEKKVILFELINLVFVFLLNYDGYFFDSILILLVERLGIKYIVGFIDLYLFWDKVYKS